MLVIFDCDGVLVDSEELSAVVFSEALAELDIVMSTEHCLRDFRGQTLDACYAIIAQRFGTAIPSGFDARLAELTLEAFSNKLEAVAGIKDVLAILSEHAIPFCVASNGALKKTNHSLHCAGLDPYFSMEQRFSAEQVAHGKPAPDLFLYAAEQSGVPSKFCYVIEDSLPGCRAATQAGMRLISFKLSADELRTAGIEPYSAIDDMAQLVSLFESRI